MKNIIFIFYFGIAVADYGGGYAGSGFRYGSNAREFSLGGALVADKTPGFYAFSNPALLQFARTSQIGLSYQNMSLDRSIQSICYVKNLPPSAGVGLAIIRAGTDNIQGRNTMNEETKTFSSHEIQGIISFGVSFGNRMALGINIKALFSNIASGIIDIQGGSGIGLDVGILYKLHRKLIIAGVLENLTGSYNWKLSKAEYQDSYREILPKRVKLGIVYKGFKGVSIYYQEDIVSTPGNYINYRSRLGVEYRLSKGIKLRGGFKQAEGTLGTDNKNNITFKPSLGIGMPLNLENRQFVNLDYALDPGNVGEGISHLFSFSMRLK